MDFNVFLSLAKKNQEKSNKKLKEQDDKSKSELNRPKNPARPVVRKPPIIQVKYKDPPPVKKVELPKPNTVKPTSSVNNKNPKTSVNNASKENKKVPSQSLSFDKLMKLAEKNISGGSSSKTNSLQNKTEKHKVNENPLPKQNKLFEPQLKVKPAFKGKQTNSIPTNSKPTVRSGGIAAQNSVRPELGSSEISRFKASNSKYPVSGDPKTKEPRKHESATPKPSFKKQENDSKVALSLCSKDGIKQQSKFKAPSSNTTAHENNVHNKQKFNIGAKRPPTKVFEQPRKTGISAQMGNNSRPASGIAAQFGGSLVTSKKPMSYNEFISDEEDYDSEMDDFIDDSECVEPDEYSRVVKDVHKALRFDPKKYASVSKYDDLSSMEVSFRETQKEEIRSARLGAREDEEDILRELEKKKRRAERAKEK